MNAERLRSQYLARWGVDLTRPVCRFLCEEHALGPLAPLDPEATLDGWSTWCGMFPRFHPFAVDDHATYGLYPSNEGAPGAPVVLRYEEEALHLQPVARGLSGLGAWAAFAALREDEPEEAELTVRHIREFGLAPPPDWPELASSAAAERDSAECRSTGCGAAPLLRQAWRRHGLGDHVGALEAAWAACSEAPFFVDAWYSAACLAGSEEERVRALHTALRQPASISSRLEEYDLGPEKSEGHVLAACLSEYRALAPAPEDGDPLEEIIMAGRGILSAARLEIAGRFMALGDAGAAEREMLAAVGVATSEEEAVEALQALAALYKRQRRAGEAAWCVMLADSE